MNWTNFRLPYLFKNRIFSMQMSALHHPSCPVPIWIKNQNSPTSIFPTNIRPGQVDGAIVPPVLGVFSEKRTDLRAFRKYLVIVIPVSEGRSNRYLMFLAGILVLDQKFIIIVPLDDGKYLAEITATFTTLYTFKSQSSTPLPVVCLMIMHTGFDPQAGN
jgi:hypothetical protein